MELSWAWRSKCGHVMRLDNQIDGKTASLSWSEAADYVVLGSQSSEKVSIVTVSQVIRGSAFQLTTILWEFCQYEQHCRISTRRPRIWTYSSSLLLKIHTRSWSKCCHELRSTHGFLRPPLQLHSRWPRQLTAANPHPVEATALWKHHFSVSCRGLAAKQHARLTWTFWEYFEVTTAETPGSRHFSGK